MSELSFEQMLEESLKTIRTGEVVEGTVIGVKEDEIILNIGYKADGIITRNEYTNTSNVDLTTLVHEGDKMQAKVLKVNDGDGYVMLTYKRLAAENGRIIGDRKQLLVAEKQKRQEEVLSKISVGQTVEGTVKNVTDFGVFIDIGGVDGLLHISEMSWGRIENPKKVFKPGDHVKAFIKDIQGDKIALSLKFEDTNPWPTAEQKYAVGNVVKGKVARMTDFGAFVELEPGIDALLHVSQIALEHVDKPSDVLKVGQEIEAKVVDFNLESKKISLSIKALLAPAKDEDKAEDEQ